MIKDACCFVFEGSKGILTSKYSYHWYLGIWQVSLGPRPYIGYILKPVPKSFLRV